MWFSLSKLSTCITWNFCNRFLELTRFDFCKTASNTANNTAISYPTIKTIIIIDPILRVAILVALPLTVMFNLVPLSVVFDLVPLKLGKVLLILCQV